MFDMQVSKASEFDTMIKFCLKNSTQSVNVF